MPSMDDALPILASLFKPLRSLRTLANKTAMEKSYGERIMDLLLTRPIDFLENRIADSVINAVGSNYIGIKVRVVKVVMPQGWKRRSPWRVFTEDSRGESLVLVFFQNKGGYLQKLFAVGSTKIVFGAVEQKYGYQMIHPKMVLAENSPIKKYKAVYQGTVQPSLSGIEEALTLVEEAVKESAITEWLPNPPEMSFAEALTALHQPKDLAQHETALKRLTLDELFARQIMLAIEQKHIRKGTAIVAEGKPSINLPFELTTAQQNAIQQISKDLAAPSPMNRLLQGDVGSGKTIVAIMAMLQTASAGFQAVLMAPTESLAEQHFATISQFVASTEVVILKGSQTAIQKRQVAELIASGKVKLIVGTHTLFQEKIRFAKLGLAIVDEQQRFGVAQRVRMAKKGKGVNMLSLSATPIPRSLALSKHFGINLSVLDEKPKGRLPTKTSMVSISRLAEVVERLEGAIGRGEMAFWVCATIDTLETRFHYIKERIKNVAMAHGAMPMEERTAAINDFKNRNASILVATTIIEVGIDIPTADIMVVENAERFGLAQLHQLRGRIGRGGGKGKMLGLYGEPLSALAHQRLECLKQSDDGFYLAEKDLELRKSGELLGTRQSGLEEYRFFSYEHYEMVTPAHQQAVTALKLKNKRALKNLLDIFGFEPSAPLS